MRSLWGGEREVGGGGGGGRRGDEEGRERERERESERASERESSTILRTVKPMSTEALASCFAFFSAELSRHWRSCVVMTSSGLISMPALSKANSRANRGSTFSDF